MCWGVQPAHRRGEQSLSCPALHPARRLTPRKRRIWADYADTWREFLHPLGQSRVSFIMHSPLNPYHHPTHATVIPTYPSYLSRGAIRVTPLNLSSFTYTRKNFCSPFIPPAASHPIAEHNSCSPQSPPHQMPPHPRPPLLQPPLDHRPYSRSQTRYAAPERATTKPLPSGPITSHSSLRPIPCCLWWQDTRSNSFRLHPVHVPPHFLAKESSRYRHARFRHRSGVYALSMTARVPVLYRNGRVSPPG